MKRMRVLAVLAIQVALPMLALGHGNERGVVKARIGGGEVTVDHGRPMAKGRDVMALITPGSYWRMGSDAATTLTTDVDLKVGGKTVPKGKYTLLAHFVGAGEWRLVVATSASPTWEPVGVVAEAPGTMTKISPVVETLTVQLETEGKRGKLHVEWGARRLTAEFAAE